MAQKDILIGLIVSLATLIPAMAAPAEVTPGDWRLVIATEIGDLPINLHLDRKGAQWSAAFINGPEKMAAEQVSVAGATLTIVFPSYGSQLQATVAADGAITGTLSFRRATGPLVIPIQGHTGRAWRFFPQPAAKYATLGGRWAISMPGFDGSKRTGLAELKQTGNVIDGTTMFFNADARFLNGEVRGDDLYLSTFDGGQGSLWVGHRAADGTLNGKSFSLVTNGVAAWEGHADATAKLEDPNALTYLKPGYAGFDFSFPNLDGKLVSLKDPAYRGKVVIVTIAGSWCPTCHDETAFLEPYYRGNRGRGLEVIGLMYEASDKFDQAVAACRNFQKRYSVDWQMLIAGTSDKAAASKTLPMINAVLAYPTMIIVDRKGQVRRIHTGFPGPATGIHHDEFKREFNKLMDDLLGEKV